MQTAIQQLVTCALTDPIVDGIEEKIADWTHIPKENGEAIQVLRYQYQEKYEAHFDYFHDKNNQALGGHRIATVLMYLSDVEFGGETVFPSATTDQPKDSTWSDCARRGVAVKPRKGDAILFFNLHPDATPDPSSLHTGCPVIRGEKWSATKWLHVGNFDQPSFKTSGGSSCYDASDHCVEWAAAGECERNPEFMLGAGNFPGKCRKSCKACTPTTQFSK
ncbi:hypothetical protein CBR_g5717 [Chara braunii]|uniref:procollagen-proline 4-dioxygenase n=1 Tax=Chara braunii TaxID=69332 RepID=A0A388KJ45_CHABU|nr:hypothetical protein CBR_g5717 [Chara braunii]|eukprot:GBG70085.1 hypothetical protein CBR_g5717 [Chara braunii]